MKNDDAPKVVVWVYSNNIASRSFKIGRFSRLVLLTPQAAKFGFSNLVPRILLLFTPQSRPRLIEAPCPPFATLLLRFPSKLCRSQRRILSLLRRIQRGCRRISPVSVFDTKIKWKTARPKTRMPGHTCTRSVPDAVVLLLCSPRRRAVGQRRGNMPSPPLQLQEGLRRAGSWGREFCAREGTRLNPASPLSVLMSDSTTARPSKRPGK